MWAEQDDAERKGDRGPEQRRSAAEAAFLEHFSSDEVSQIVQKQVLSQPCQQWQEHCMTEYQTFKTDIMHLTSKERCKKDTSQEVSMHGTQHAAWELIMLSTLWF